MSSSGGHYGGGDWGQSGDPWGQGGQPSNPGQPGQPGGQGWQQPTQEWGGQQPPAGGAPHEQGGWGAGQQQQQPGGWGAGQTAQQPPHQQGWDAGQAQQQQQGGWGAPGTEWQQQGQPQWGQPGYGQPVPGQKSNKGLIIGLSAGGGGLVLVIIIVLIAVFATRGGGDDGGTGGGGGDGGGGVAQKWSVPVPDSRNDASTLTAFVTQDKNALVRISQAGITAYDLTTGKQKFSIAVPSGAQVCAGTRGAPDGIAGLVFGTDDHCSTVAAIDVNAGKQLWTTNFKVNDAKFPPLDAAVTAAAGKIYVVTGERLIQYDAKGGPDATGSAASQAIVPKEDSLCDIDGVAATDKVVVTTLRCGSTTTLSGLSPSKLTTEVFSTKLDMESSSRVTVVSASPVIVHVTNALDNGELRLFDDKGTQTKVISSRQPQGTLVLSPTLSSGFNDMNRDFPFQIVGTTLVAAVDKGDNNDAQDQVAGINLQTGQWAWAKNLGSTNDFTLGVSADDPTKVFALDEGGYTSDYSKKLSPQSYLIDPAKQGAVTKGDKLDVGDSSLYLSFTTTVMSAHKEIILLSTSSTGGDKPLITAYGK